MNKKLKSALDRIAKARAGAAKNAVLAEATQDPEIREALRLFVDPNEATAIKPQELVGVGVSVLNRACAGLVKALHIATPQVVDITRLVETLVPVEEWVQILVPSGARVIVNKGVARSSHGFMCNLPGEWPDTVLDGILVLPGGGEHVSEYYDAIKKGDTDGARFVAIDAVNESATYRERRAFLETTGIETAEIIPATELQPRRYLAFRRLTTLYVIGRDSGFVIAGGGEKR